MLSLIIFFEQNQVESMMITRSFLSVSFSAKVEAPKAEKTEKKVAKTATKKATAKKAESK